MRRMRGVGWECWESAWVAENAANKCDNRNI